MENQTVTVSPTGIKKEVKVGELRFGNLHKSKFQKQGTMTAELRQTVTTLSLYPGQRVASNMNATIFDIADFGIAPKPYESYEERVAWVNVPETVTEDEVKAAVAVMAAKGGCIYRVLSCAPILTDDQVFAINSPAIKLTKDDIADTQVCRYPTTPDKSGKMHPQAGQLILDGHKRPMYRKTFFWNEPRQDEDRRETETPYVSPKIAAELVGASMLQGQLI